MFQYNDAKKYLKQIVIHRLLLIIYDDMQKVCEDFEDKYWMFQGQVKTPSFETVTNKWKSIKYLYF